MSVLGLFGMSQNTTTPVPVSTSLYPTLQQLSAFQQQALQNQLHNSPYGGGLSVTYSCHSCGRNQTGCDKHEGYLFVDGNLALCDECFLAAFRLFADRAKTANKHKVRERILATYNEVIADSL